MIGPHEGKELEFMLLGKKHLAAFSDIVPDNGVIDEKIIPEKKFQPYVDSGQFIRLSSEFIDLNNCKIRIVCYSSIGEEWRAKSYIFIRQKIHQKEIKYENAIDQYFGYLLGYSKEDIDDFLNHGLQRNNKN